VSGRLTLPAAAAQLSGRATLYRDLATQTLFRYAGLPRRGIPTVSYYQALDADASLPPQVFKDKVVFVGHSLNAPVEGASGRSPTPLGSMAGVEIQATIFDALVRGRLIADPFASSTSTLLVSALVAALMAIGLYRLGPTAGATLLSGAALAVAALAFGLLTVRQVRVPVLAPIVIMAAVYATTAAYRYTLLTRERRLIKRAFQSYVAPAIVEQMLNDPSQLKLGGQERDVTVMFSDLEGFTTLSERLDPEALRAHLSGYFKTMVDVLLAERATLDKFIGDAIMVYFGCPVADANHPSQACRGALAMQRQMVVLNAQWAAGGIAPLRTRIGINSGRAVAGNMGTDTIFNFTVLGDCVNLASRLEGVNKEYGTSIIMGADTHARTQNQFETRELDWIRVKGKHQPVAIYELAGEAGSLDARQRELFGRYASGLALYRRMNWSAAAVEFGAALELDSQDGPSRVFLHRCREYAAGRALSEWDGVHVMTTK
jgi:adenylate cyclase